MLRGFVNAPGERVRALDPPFRAPARPQTVLEVSLPVPVALLSLLMVALGFRHMIRHAVLD